MLVILESLFTHHHATEIMSCVLYLYPVFGNVCCLGLPPESNPQKHKYRSATMQPCSSAASSVDMDSKMTVAEVVVAPQATAAVDVVASMHSYAMPGYIGIPTKFVPRHTAVGAEHDHKASNDKSEAGDTAEHTVSHHYLCCKGTELFFVWLMGTNM